MISLLSYMISISYSVWGHAISYDNMKGYHGTFHMIRDSISHYNIIHNIMNWYAMICDMISCFAQTRSDAAASAGSHRCTGRGLVASQVTQQHICSPDPALADPPTPLAAGAGDAVALKSGGGMICPLAGPAAAQHGVARRAGGSAACAGTLRRRR